MTPIPYNREISHLATSNYADYIHKKPYVCCAWMDIHCDEDYGIKHRLFKLRIIYIHPRARFIHKSKGKYIKEIYKLEILSNLISVDRTD